MMIFRNTIPRRTFLRGVGAAVALPLLDGMVPAFASESAAKPNLRLGIVYVPNGIIHDKWEPATEGAGFEMTPSLTPLAPFRDRMLVLGNLDQKNAAARPGEGGAFHSRSCATFLTGVHAKPTEGNDLRAGVSFDQIAAKEFGKHTQLSSLELALDPPETAGACEPQYTCTYMNTLCWRGPTTPLPMEDQPRAVFERLFGDSDTTSPADRLARIQLQRSLLDGMTEDVGRFEKKLGPGDRAKLDEYLDAVRDVERRIQIAESQASEEIPTLERPTAIPASFDAYAKLMIDLQVLAYQTDLTRVSSLMIAHERSGRTYSEIGVPDAHHSLSHHRGDPRSIAKLVQINTYHVQLLAYLLEKLQSTRNGSGSLLDHTVILYGSGLSDGNLHTNNNLPLLVIGGAATQIKGGRFIQYPAGTPMANLYLTLLDKLGVKMDNLGDSTGKLDLLSVG